ncbi:MAG: hypothetical protein QOK31_1487 [Solirubrobacteraceae bacterium]|nr:hypothetical protein [Solirubrobacteraceae bacterium]
MTPPPWWHDDASLCYVVLEQARIACETLLEETGERRERDVLEVARSSLGLGGYIVSDGLDPDLRAALLELVRCHGHAPVPPATGELERICLLTLHGRALAARGARRPVQTLTMELVHRHTRHALGALEKLLGPRRVAALTRDARAGGYFDEAWQRECLAPLPASWAA